MFPWLGRITGSSAGQSVDHSHLLVFVHNAAQLGQILFNQINIAVNKTMLFSTLLPRCFSCRRTQPPTNQPVSRRNPRVRRVRPSVRPRPSASVSRLLVGKVEGPRGRFLGRTERSGQKISAEYDSPPSLPPSISRASDPTSNWGNKCTEWKHAA